MAAETKTRPTSCAECVLGLWCIAGAPITVELCKKCLRVFRMFPGDDRRGGFERYARGIDPSEVWGDCPRLQGKLGNGGAEKKGVVLMDSSLCLTCLETMPRQSQMFAPMPPQPPREDYDDEAVRESRTWIRMLDLRR